MARRASKNRVSSATTLQTARPAAGLDTLVSSWRSWLPQALIILAVGLWTFWPSLNGGWIWDDAKYITKNQIIGDPSGFWQVWVSRDGQGDYYPLTSFVEWILWQTQGNATLAYHLVTVLLHLASALLIWRLFARIGLPLAWIGGLLFAVHPVMVESVAWITELKNTLSLPPLLLAMLAWLHWKSDGAIRFYRLALLLFIISLLAKTSGLMLPVIFLGYIWAAQGKISRKDIQSLTPFFVVGLLAAVITVFPHGDPANPGDLQSTWNFGAALASTGWSLLFLLGDALLPLHTLPVYSGFLVQSFSAIDLLPWVGLVGLFALLWRSRSGLGRYLLFGLGFFVINLVPVLGFIFLKYTIMVWSMDHLIYLPIIGLLGLLVAALGQFEARVPSAHIVVVGFFTIVTALMAFDSRALASTYINEEALWRYTLGRDPESWLAHNNLATVLLDQGEVGQAIAHGNEVLRLKPDYSDGHYNMGVMLEKVGDNAGAQAAYREALKLSPREGKIYINLAGSLFKTGDRAGAIAQYREAIQSVPAFAQLRYNLGSLLLQSRDLPAAIEQLQVAVRLDPKMAQAHENLGSALAQTGHVPEAIEHFQAAVDLNPNYVIARDNLALALAQSGRIPEAIDQFKKVLEIDPNNAPAQAALSKLQR